MGKFYQAFRCRAFLAGDTPQGQIKAACVGTCYSHTQSSFSSSIPSPKGLFVLKHPASTSTNVRAWKNIHAILTVVCTFGCCAVQPHNVPCMEHLWSERYAKHK